MHAPICLFFFLHSSAPQPSSADPILLDVRHVRSSSTETHVHYCKPMICLSFDARPAGPSRTYCTWQRPAAAAGTYAYPSVDQPHTASLSCPPVRTTGRQRRPLKCGMAETRRGQGRVLMRRRRRHDVQYADTRIFFYYYSTTSGPAGRRAMHAYVSASPSVPTAPRPRPENLHGKWQQVQHRGPPNPRRRPLPHTTAAASTKVWH
jgi:hypothetical protein